MTSYREQRARLRALAEPVDGPVVLFKVHDTLGELERVFTCAECGAHVAVGPCWEHIVDEYVCGACQAPDVLPMGDASPSVVESAGRAGTGQQDTARGGETG